MADLSITVSNSLLYVGPAPSSKWGTMVWGVDRWGESTDTQVLVDKWLTAETLSLSQSLTISVLWYRAMEESISGTFEMDSETLQTSNGWYYVFPLPTTDADARDASSYSSGSAGSTTYTSASVASTTWS